MKRGKKYQEAVKSFDKAAQYDVAEAISLVKKNATAKFDETIELHIRTGCDKFSGSKLHLIFASTLHSGVNIYQFTDHPA